VTSETLNNEKMIYVFMAKHKIMMYVKIIYVCLYQW
jgi:cell division protein FtsL